MANLHDGNCTLVWQDRNGNIKFDYVEINGKGKQFKNLVCLFYQIYSVSFAQPN